MTHLLLATLVAGSLNARLSLLAVLVVVVAAAGAALGAGHAALPLRGGATAMAGAHGAGRAPGRYPAAAGGNGRTVHAGGRGRGGNPVAGVVVSQARSGAVTSAANAAIRCCRVLGARDRRRCRGARIEFAALARAEEEARSAEYGG